MRYNYLFVFFLIFISFKSAFGSTFIVTNNAETGPGSLAQAILDANAQSGIDSIHFAIVSSSVADRTITLTAPLPQITGRVVIDANSQPFSKYFGSSQTRIQIVGSSYLSNCFYLSGDSIEIYGFFIHHFTTGLLVTGSDCRIGGTYDGNVIFDCTDQCIHVEDCKQASVVGNFIGIDTTGKKGSSTTGIGILIENGSKITIGGKQAGGSNIISGNTTGLFLAACTYMAINKNYIGTDINTSAAIPNATGIYIDSFCNNITVGGDSSKDMNVISGNTGNGIESGMNASSILGNKIGTDSTGINQVGNGGYGIYLLSGSKKLLIGKIGGTSGNVIAYNDKEGIYFQEKLIKTVTIQGNSIFCNSQKTGNGGIVTNGGNEGIQMPEIKIIDAQGIMGTAPPRSAVDIYSVSTCNTCEGKTFITSAIAASNGVFTVLFSVDGKVTALATDSLGNTSAFADCKDTSENSCLVAGFINSPPSACSGTPITFLDQSLSDFNTAITSWSWSFSTGETSTEQNPTITFNTDGSYQATLTVTNSLGCTSSITKTIEVTTGAKAGFVASTKDPCIGDLVIFTDNSTSTSGSRIVSYNWDFGDGTTAASQNTSHTYNSIATFSVTLTVTTDLQCSSSHSENITVHDPPQAKFGADATDVCLGTPINFTDSSTAGNGAVIKSYFYDFGNGDSSTRNNPHYYYTTPGTYTVTLTVTNNFGCSNSYSISVTTHDFPIAQFTSTPKCVGENVQFTDQSTVDNSLDIVSWFWDFGDKDSTSTQQNPRHQYESVGVYTVTLTITDNLGCMDTRKAEISIVTGPTVSFSISDTIACQGTLLTFTDQTDTSGTLVFWHWNFGDQANANSPDTTHAYQTPGVFVVTLEVINRSQCMGTAHDTVTILEQPAAFFFAPAQNCLNETISFLDQSTGGTGATVTSWLWNFGDGSTSDVSSPSHQYTADGTYQVTLTVQNSLGCFGTYSQTVDIISQPQAGFVYNIAYPSVEFTNTSINSTNSVYTWDFGDGTTSNLSNPIHNYSAQASYNVCLIVTDNSCGASDTICQAIFVTGIASLPNTISQYISVTPNPAGNIVMVNSLKEDLKIEEIRMLNDLGAEVYYHNSFVSNSSIPVSISNMAGGMYALQIKTNRGYAFKKIFHLVK
ncbi:MAG: PKD domain-containing protein [Chitinophagales bacterium]|nr:PKD domain-containing protein [Chitinophagales bacterium]